MEIPRVILGKDTVADKKYLQVSDERITQVENNQERLVSRKDSIDAQIAQLTADRTAIETEIARKETVISR